MNAGHREAPDSDGEAECPADLRREPALQAALDGVLDERLQGEISAMLELQLKDNVKRRKLDKKQRNRFVKRPEGAPAVESHRGLHTYYAEQVRKP